MSNFYLNIPQLGKHLIKKKPFNYVAYRPPSQAFWVFQEGALRKASQPTSLPIWHRPPPTPKKHKHSVGGSSSPLRYTQGAIGPPPPYTFRDRLLQKIGSLLVHTFSLTNTLKKEYFIAFSPGL